MSKMTHQLGHRPEHGEAQYQCDAGYLLRVPARPMSFATEVLKRLSADADGSVDPEHELLALAHEPSIRRALSIASPDLLEAVDRLTGPTTGLTAKKLKSRAKQLRRLRSRTLRYLLRLAARPTPFGTFAGVSWGKFTRDEGPGVTFSAVGGGRVRPDFGWVLELIRLIEADPKTRGFLRVRTNDLLHSGPTRVYLSQVDTHGAGRRQGVNVRLTEPLRCVLEFAIEGPTHADLQEMLMARFPSDNADVIDTFLKQIWDQSLIMSDLRPALSSPRPDVDLLTSLERLPHNAGLDDLVDGLRAISETCTRLHGCATAADLDELRAMQRKLTPEFSGPLLQVDAALEVEHPPALPLSLAAELESAVGALTAVTRAAPPQNAHLSAFRSAFADRYGLNALVPVQELLNSRTGMGSPDTYAQPGRSWAMPPAGETPHYDTSAYERVLIELIRDAERRGRGQVELTDEWIQRLQSTRSEVPNPPAIPVIDVYAQIGQHAETGAWQVVLRDDSITYGGRTFGRFHDVLGPQAREDLHRLAEWDASRRPAAVMASISYLPTSGHAANVTLVPQLHSHEVAINCQPSGQPAHRISVEELAVGATESHLYLWSTRLRRRVIVAQGHMLNIISAPDVVRFLIEVSNDGYLVPQGFSWLGLEAQTRLPRVVRGATVLHPAQWRVDTGSILEGLSPRTHEARAALKAWMDENDLPRWCYLVDEDNRLLLDVHHPGCLDEILEAASANHTSTVVLQEMVPGFDSPLVRDNDGLGHLTELVVPMRNEAADPGDLEPLLPVGAAGSENLQYTPGSRWTYIKVYADDHQQEELVAKQLPDLVSTLRSAGLIDRWFFIRYLDPRPHLRLRVRAAHEGHAGEVLAATVSAAHAWVQSGLANDLELGSYHPEVGRYGGSEVFDVVEATFEFSSDLTTQVAGRLSENGGELDSDEVAVVLLAWLYSSWGYDEDGLVDVVPRGAGSDEMRAKLRASRERLCALVAPDLFVDTSSTTHATLMPLLAPGTALVRAAGEAVRYSAAAGDLRGEEIGIVGSLAHMLINRMWSVDRARENEMYFLTHEVLRAVRGRRVAVERASA